MGFAEYGRYDALGLAELVKKREVTPRELLDEAIARCERVNPVVNAIVTRMYDEARKTVDAGVPDGPFSGVPFLLKDLLAAYAGVRLTAACRYYSSYVPAFDSELVRRYKRAGLVVFGKTNTSELGLVPVAEPELHGPTHTPWRLGHASGGLSGGSAAAVASGIVPAAHGGDGGGSIRIPASCCGVFGLKPSRGRTPLGPDRSQSWFGYAIEHVLTRSVRDSAALLDATVGTEAGEWYPAAVPARPFLAETRTPPGKLRIALSTKPQMPSNVRPECVRAAQETAALLEELGHDVEEAHPDIDPDAFAREFLVAVAAATAADPELGAAVVGRPGTRADYERVTWLAVLLGRQIGAPRLVIALDRLQAIARELGRFFERYDALLTPTLGRPPPKFGELEPRGADAIAQQLIVAGNLSAVLKLPGLIERMAKTVYDFIPFTALANVAGAPSMSLPLHVDDVGLPIGSMITGKVGDEATLFRLAAQIEEARPWVGRRPAVHAD